MAKRFTESLHKMLDSWCSECRFCWFEEKLCLLNTLPGSKEKKNFGIHFLYHSKIFCCPPIRYKKYDLLECENIFPLFVHLRNSYIVGYKKRCAGSESPCEDSRPSTQFLQVIHFFVKIFSSVNHRLSLIFLLIKSHRCFWFYFIKRKKWLQ